LSLVTLDRERGLKLKLKYEELEPAMGVYPLNRRNKAKLYDCEFVEVTECEQLNATVFVFQDKYRKLKIDVFFLENGELLLGDFYGDTMKREDMVFVRINGAK
jgi:hypothetical protein